MSIREEKQALRLAMRRRRDALSPETRAAWSEAIRRNVALLPQFAEADCVHVFCSFGSETDTTDIIRTAFTAGKRVIVPVTPDKHMVDLRHVEIFPYQQYMPGVFGIPIPHFPGREDYPYCEPHTFFRDSDCIIVPLLAFDRRGHRLGYGRGFYDRFLRTTRGYTIGIAFSIQEVERLPVEDHDRPLDCVVTELS